MDDLQFRRLGRIPSTDHGLLGAVGDGSKCALFELFDRHGPATHAFVSLLVSDAKKAETVVEEVFVRLWRAGGRLEDSVANVRLGLLAMARRRVVGDEESHEMAGLLGGEHCHGLALIVLAEASLAEVALVLGADRVATSSQLRAGLRSVRTESHGLTPGQPPGRLTLSNRRSILRRHGPRLPAERRTRRSPRSP